MRERDLNLHMRDEKELHRIKTILFPKRNKESSHSAQIPTPKSTPDNGLHMRSEIQKLRGEISSLLVRGKGGDPMASTERAYLDGINRLTKQLKNNANEINEVFEEFLAHLPTKMTNELHQYNSHYYFSMLVQNVAWTKIAEITRKPLVEAFAALKEQAEEKRVFEERVGVVEKERKERLKARMCCSLSKYFNIWRFNNKCIQVKLESEEYLRENNLQNDQKLTHSLLNLPLLVLMLEQLGRESADISELLVLDQSRERACKYIQQGQSVTNSSIETVTQRSLLVSERSNMKFSRFDIQLTSSLTKQCIQSGQILFVNNLSKNHDYSQVDNLSYWQSLGKSNPQCLKGGAIFYPIFDMQQNCVAVLRQYFYEGVLNAISNKKLQKICTFLQLGLKMERRTRIVAKEKEYQRQGYYIKMIGLLKKMEHTEGSEKESMSVLSDELRNRLGVSGMAIYRVEKKESADPKDIFLRKLWGESEDCKFLITLVHQLLKQHSNYIYLQNRLVVYSNHTLFDLKLQENLYSDSRNHSGKQNILPIDLIVGALAKIQTILVSKQKESREVIIKEQLEKEKQVSKERNQLRQDLQQETLNLLATKGEKFIVQIKRYIKKIYSLVSNLSISEKIEQSQPKFYLECYMGNFRKDRALIRLGENDSEVKQQERPQLSQLLKVELTDIITLYCDLILPKQGKQYLPLIGTAIRDYFKSSTSDIFNPTSTDEGYFDIMSDYSKNEQAIPAFPSRQEKKKWEISKMSSLFKGFSQAIQRLILSCFGCSASIAWQRQAPDGNNIEGWKQYIYKVCLLDQQNISLQIINKNAMISYAQYRQLKLLTNYAFPCIEEASSLVISNSKSIYRSRNTVQNSITVGLPLYFHSQEDDSQCQKIVRRKLDQLKAIFLRMCQGFVDGVNAFNERFQSTSAKSIIAQIQKYQSQSKKNAFNRIHAESSRRMKTQRFTGLALLHLQTFTSKLLWHSLQSISGSSLQRYSRKRLDTYNHEQIKLFCDKANKLLFKNCFNRLKEYHSSQIKIERFVKALQSYAGSAEKELKYHYFTELHIFSKKQTNIGIFNEILSALFTSRLYSCLNQLKTVKEIKTISTLSYAQFEKCQSLEQIKEHLCKFTPEYSLFLQINEEECFTLYSPRPEHYLSFQTVQSAYMPLDPMLSYQCGSEGQLIWNYSLGCSEDCFQVKDRLSSLGKCIELGVKNCRKMMEISLLKCSVFHRNWKREVKCRFFRQWGAASREIEMGERNRLNDSLYQVSIETQTVKEKLKTQEKIMRNNHNQYLELLRKQEEYRQQMVASGEKVALIEEQQCRLESSKAIYHSLHRRTTLKTVFVQWRKNSSAATLLIQQHKLARSLPLRRTALTTLAHLFATRKRDYLRHFLCALVRGRREEGGKWRGVERIEVMFEERPDRLVTFQSELEQQENSNQHSNRSEWEDSQVSYNKRKFQRQRSPLQRVQVSAEEYVRYNNGAYKLNPKTLKFLKRMGKLEG